MKTLAAFLMLAAAAPASAAPAGWKEMIGLFGSRTTLDQKVGFVVERITGPEDGPHRADYAMCGGLADCAGGVRLIAEDWRKLPDGKTAIEIWWLRLTPEGELTDVKRQFQLRHAEAIAIVLEQRFVEVSAEEADAKLQAVVSDWLKWAKESK